jgi:hypothetical protein
VTPWLLKNWSFTNNPVYPFVFGGQFWDNFRAAAYRQSGTGIGLNPVALLRLPYDMSLGYADASREATIGPFYLVFLPLFVFYSVTGATRRAPPALKLLLLYALFSFLVWTVGVISSAALYQARLLLPGIVALCPVLAWVMEDLSRYDHPQFSLRRFINLVLGFVVFLLFLNQLATWLTINPIPFLTGAETKADYLERQLGAHYQIMHSINGELPSQAVVLFLWEPRSYYCDLDCRPDSILDRFEHSIHLYETSKNIADAWRLDGVTHVLILEAGLDFLLENGTIIDQQQLQSLRNHHLTTIETIDDIYTLYQLQTTN